MGMHTSGGTGSQGGRIEAQDTDNGKAEAMKIHPQYSMHRGCVELWMFEERNGKRGFAENIVFKVPEEEGLYESPTATMGLDEAQELANSLWSAGIRPEQSRQAQGAHDAQGRHLEDMRSLAFAKLNVDKPQ